MMSDVNMLSEIGYMYAFFKIESCKNLGLVDQ